MEKKTDKIFFEPKINKSGQGEYACKLYIAKSWLKKMGITSKNREVDVTFDGDRVIIERVGVGETEKSPLADKSRIYKFALIWEQLYKNHANTPNSFFEEVCFVGEGMKELGFEMDSGESLAKAFPNEDLTRLDAWKRIVVLIDDIKLLGDGIFSYWRYWNHWAMAPMSNEDYEWFAVGFNRLAELTK